MSLPKTEVPLWLESYPKKIIYKQLTEDFDVDVVIVGGGITGMTAAYLLKKSGKKVAVLEKDKIGSGTTGRTTGKVSSQHNLIYADMINRLGKKSARHYAEANQKAITVIKSIVENEKINCEFNIDSHYLYTTDKSKTDEIKKEAKAAQLLGLPAKYVSSTPLPFKVEAAVEFNSQAKINSQKYLLGLGKAVNGNGSFVFENSKVDKYKDGKKVYVKSNGYKVSADAIIVATKIPRLPLAARLSYGLYEYPTESFAIAAMHKGSLRGMYISPDKNNYSILPMKVNGKNMIVITGAGGNIPGIRLSKDQRYKRIIEYAKKHFEIGKVTHTWADMDYFPYDNYPMVGKVYPWSKNLYMATGFMKWGLTNGTAAAQILTDVINNKPNKYLKSFDSTRFRPVKSIPLAAARYIKK